MTCTILKCCVQNLMVHFWCTINYVFYSYVDKKHAADFCIRAVIGHGHFTAELDNNFINNRVLVCIYSISE